MSGLSKVIVLDPDARASRQVQLGFEREGVPTSIAPVPQDPSKLELFDSRVPGGPDGANGNGASLLVVGGTVEARSLELIRRARALLDSAQIDAPIVFAGRGVRRTDAEAAGADEVLLQPSHLRDVVTVGRLLRGQPADRRTHIVGNLAETTGVFTLVRALSALGRSAVLTLIRGLRRGEVRFFHGEVTSAQVGLIHGQAALHQLLLWTDARFDFHHEDIVRRQQIPLDHDELFADAERFLGIVRDESGSLSPSMVLEQDIARIHSLGKQIPTEVHGVLRMFDGHRVLADVLEDSPYRVFETLRVAQRACEAGLLRQNSSPRPKATWRAVLSIEEWLVGSARDEGERAADSGSMKAAAVDSTGPRLKGSRRKRKKRRANTPLPLPAIHTKPDIDWGALVPRIVGAEVGSLSGVVPAAHTSGEIVTPTREAPRERLEALMDTDKRERIFPRDIGIEPSVVFDENQEPERAKPAPEDGASRDSAADLASRLAASRTSTADRERLEADARAAAEMASRAEVEAKAAAEAKATAEAKAAGEAKAAAEAKAATEAKAAEAKPIDVAAAAAQAKAQAEAEVKARAEADAQAAAAVEAKFRAEAEVRARADTEAAQLAKVRAEIEAARLAAEARTRAEADAARLATEARARAEAEHRARIAAEAKAAADKAEAEIRAAQAKAKADAKAGRGDSKRTRAAKRDARRRDAEEAKLVAQARADAEARVAAQLQSIPEEDPSDLERTAPRVLVDPGAVTTNDLVKQLLAADRGPEPAVEKPPASTSITAVAQPVVPAVPVETYDEPSDGVIRNRYANPESAPQQRPRAPSHGIPIDDRPDDTTGEITTPVSRDDLVATAEPTILVADLAAVHHAVSAVAVAQVAAPRTANASTPSKELAIVEAHKDAQAAFTDIEEDFFRAGHDKTGQAPKSQPMFESFDDLDEGYQPVGFWDRLLGRKPQKPKPGR